MDYPAIKAEIESGNYSGLNDHQIAAALMAKTVTPAGHVDVPVASVVGYLALRGKIAGLQQYVKTGTGQADALVAAAELLTLISTPSLTMFWTSTPAVYDGIKDFLDALVADSGSGIAQADADALLALAAPPSVPFGRNPGETIDAGAVRFARTMP